MRFFNIYPEGQGVAASPENFNVWRAQTNIFQDVAAYDFGGPGFNLTGDIPEQVHGIHVSEAYFRLFGAPVLLGRTFTPQEDSPDGGHVVVLSYGFWQRKFGGNPKIVGSAISLSNESYTVIGVLGNRSLPIPPPICGYPFRSIPTAPTPATTSSSPGA